MDRRSEPEGLSNSSGSSTVWTRYYIEKKNRERKRRENMTTNNMDYYSGGLNENWIEFSLIMKKLMFLNA